MNKQALYLTLKKKREQLRENNMFIKEFSNTQSAASLRKDNVELLKDIETLSKDYSKTLSHSK